MEEKAFSLRSTNMNMWINVVVSLAKPKIHTDKIWIEQDPVEYENELKELGMEYRQITRLFII